MNPFLVINTLKESTVDVKLSFSWQKGPVHAQNSEMGFEAFFMPI